MLYCCTSLSICRQDIHTLCLLWPRIEAWILEHPFLGHLCLLKFLTLVPYGPEKYFNCFIFFQFLLLSVMLQMHAQAYVFQRASTVLEHSSPELLTWQYVCCAWCCENGNKGQTLTQTEWSHQKPCWFIVESFNSLHSRLKVRKNVQKQHSRPEK